MDWFDESYDTETAWKLVSDALARMEEYFVAVLEQIPPTQEFSELINGEIGGESIVGLSAIASCRKAFQEGNAISALRYMNQAHEDCDFVVDEMIDDKADASYVESGRAARAAREAGLKAILQKHKRERGNRLVDFKMWRREGLTEPQCWDRASKVWWSLKKKDGKKVRITKEQARRSIKDALKNKAKR